MTRRDCMGLRDGNKRRLAFNYGRGSLRSCVRGGDVADKGKRGQIVLRLNSHDTIRFIANSYPPMLPRLSILDPSSSDIALRIQTVRHGRNCA